MGRALEIIGGAAVAPGAALTAVTMFTGNSRTVRAGAGDSPIRILSAWAHFQGTAGIMQIRSSLMHDNVRGFRASPLVNNSLENWPAGFAQPVYPNDSLTIELAGSAVAGDIEQCALLIAYDDLPGVSGNFITGEEARARCKNVITVQQTLALGTAGGWSGQETLNAESDLLKRGRKYALLGGYAQTTILAIRYQSSDWGNLGIGVPGFAGEPDHNAIYFVELSDYFGIPCVPVIDADNVASILVDASMNETAAATVITTVLAEITA